MGKSQEDMGKLWDISIRFIPGKHISMMDGPATFDLRVSETPSKQWLQSLFLDDHNPSE